jgi:hypothetical protein
MPFVSARWILVFGDFIFGVFSLIARGFRVFFGDIVD